MANTIIPIPPTHCKIERQIRISFDRLSTLLYILAPVVVSPEVASKKASEKFIPLVP